MHEYVIAEPCVGVKDRACVAVCPVDCIYETPSQLVINPDECTGCSSCMDACPVRAIFPIDQLPDQWKRFAGINAAWFRTGEAREPARPRP